jgi:hypothetical protein
LIFRVRKAPVAASLAENEPLGNLFPTRWQENVDMNLMLMLPEGEKLLFFDAWLW